ncbi:MAG: glycosyltransferase [Nanoarchaeota archaeon]
MKTEKNKGSIPMKEVEKALKKQKLIFAFWNCSSKKDTPYQNYYLPLKRLFGKTILFDPRKMRYLYGSDKMNSLLLSLVEKEKPHYIFLIVRREEMTIETMDKIKKISPSTKIIAFSGDDDKDFEPLKRYQALFVDCTLVAQVSYMDNYYKDGIKNIYRTVGVNSDTFKPVKTEKIYDVTFIGKTSDTRRDFARFLIKNKINLRIFGNGWTDYSEFKDFCAGPLKTEDMVKCISQSKINLALSRNKDGKPHIKGRVFEFGLCKSFSLVDYFEGYLRLFKNGKEIVMFKDKRDLIKKINYYLKHEKEGEKIAKRAYKKAVQNHNVYEEFKRLFKKIMENPVIFVQKFPKVSGKIFNLKSRDIFKSTEEIKKLLKGFDYVSFSDGNDIPSYYKNYIQAYALEKTEKKICCCDYYVNDKILGDYLLTSVYKAFYKLDGDKFSQILSINQIATTKKYFIRNLNKFRSFFGGKEIDIIDKKNTCLISLPLVKIKKLKGMDYEVFSSSALEKRFLLNAYLLSKKNKSSLLTYFIRMIVLSIVSPLLRKSIIYSIQDKKNWSHIHNI